MTYIVNGIPHLSLYLFFSLLGDVVINTTRYGYNSNHRNCVIFTQF